MKENAKPEGETTVAEYQFLYQDDGLFERFPFPAILADKNFRLLYGNHAAMEQFPFLVMADGVRTLLSPNRPDAVLALMETDECVSMSSTVALGDHMIHVLSLDGRCPPDRLLMLTTGTPYRSLLSPGIRDSALRVTSTMRTHLSVCFASLDTLERDGGCGREPLFLIRQSCMQMLRDAANIASVSSCVSGSRPHLLYGSLSDYAQGLFGAAARILRENGYEVEVVLPQEPILTLFDAKELSQALVNLLANAGQWGAHTIQISLKRHHDAACFCVSDDGEGLPAVSEEMFLPYQYEYQPKSGIGLGLSIVKLTAVRHGGTVIASSDQEGTRFLLTIPIHRQAAHPARQLSEEDYLNNRFSSVHVGLSGIVPCSEKKRPPS